MNMHRMILVVAALGAMLLGGCVERLITVTSTPDDAQVWLNGEPVGRTPVTVPFTWHGTYAVTLRKEGYETVKAAREAQMPFYQWPLVDLVAEHLWPGTLQDQHAWHFDLGTQVLPEARELMERAEQMREETLAP